MPSRCPSRRPALCRCPTRQGRWRGAPRATASAPGGLVARLHPARRWHAADVAIALRVAWKNQRRLRGSTCSDSKGRATARRPLAKASPFLSLADRASQFQEEHEKRGSLVMPRFWGTPPDRRSGLGLAEKEALVALFRDLAAFLDVAGKAADVGHEDARLAGDVHAQIPGAAGVAQRPAGQLADVGAPVLLGLLARLDARQAVIPQIPETVGDP